jgi:hypothetical protein
MQHTQPISVLASSEWIDGCVFPLKDGNVSKALRGEHLLSGRCHHPPLCTQARHPYTGQASLTQRQCDR